MGYGTWPTAIVIEGNKAVTIAEVPVPDGLVLGWENCHTCDGGRDPAWKCDPLGCNPGDNLPNGPHCCFNCFGAARFPVWLRECGCGDGLVPAAPSFDAMADAAWDPKWSVEQCPSGCVDVGGRRMIPVRNGEQT